MGTVFPTGPLRVASDGKRGLNRTRPLRLGPVTSRYWPGAESVVPSRNRTGPAPSVSSGNATVTTGPSDVTSTWSASAPADSATVARIAPSSSESPATATSAPDVPSTASCIACWTAMARLNSTSPQVRMTKTGSSSVMSTTSWPTLRMVDRSGRGGIVGSSQTEGKEAGVMPGRGEESGAPPRIRTLLRVFAPRGRDPEMPCRNLAVPLRLRRLRPQGTVVPGFPNGTGGCPGTGEWIRRRGGCWKSSGKQNLNGFTVCHSLTNPDKIGATSCGGSLLCQVLTPSWQPVRPCTSQHQERFAFRTHACLDTHVRQYSGTQ